MTLYRLAALAVTALLLAGCQTAAERRAADEDRCRDYGFRRGSDAFAECLQRIDLDRSASLRSQRYNSAMMFEPAPRVYVVRPVPERRSRR